MKVDFFPFPFFGTLVFPSQCTKRCLEVEDRFCEHLSTLRILKCYMINQYMSILPWFKMFETYFDAFI